jgi:hypothetical protein
MVGVSAGLDPGHPPGGFTVSPSFFQDHRAGGIIPALLANGMACFASWLAISASYRRDHAAPPHSVWSYGS